MLSQLGEGGHAFAQIASLRWTVIACDQKGLCEYAVSKYSTPWNLEGISELIYPHLLYLVLLKLTSLRPSVPDPSCLCRLLDMLSPSDPRVPRRQPEYAAIQILWGSMPTFNWVVPER